MWLWLFVGIPAFLHITLVWVPAIVTGVLSFTQWDNLAPLTAIKFVGFNNYWQIFTIFDNRLFPALFNNFVLLFWLFALFGGRYVARLPARQEPPWWALLPERLLLPGGPLARRRWVHVEERDVLPRPGTAQHDLARRPRSTSSATRRRSSRSTCRCSTSRSGCLATSQPY